MIDFLTLQKLPKRDKKKSAYQTENLLLGSWGAEGGNNPTSDGKEEDNGDVVRSSETDSVRRATTRGTVLEEHEDTVDEEEVFLRDSIPEVVEESI